MKENQKDQQVTSNPGSPQKQNNPAQEGKSDPSATLVDDVQKGTEKEHHEDKHQHDSKTPVGEQKRTDGNATTVKSDPATGKANPEQRSGSTGKSSSKAL